MTDQTIGVIIGQPTQRNGVTKYPLSCVGYVSKHTGILSAVQVSRAEQKQTTVAEEK